MVVNAVAHKALLDWGGLPSTDVAYGAGFNWLYMGTETYQLIPDIRAVNPNIIIIGYFDVLFSLSTSTYPETCYFHDTNGKRISTTDGGYLMNISDPTWQGICVSNAKAQIAQGYDGVMADDTWANFYAGMYGLTAEPSPSGNWWNGYDTGAQYTRWQTALRTLLAAMQAALGSKLIICNGGSTVYPDVCAGANLEDFAFYSAADTLDEINRLETLSAAGKYIVAEPHNLAADTEAAYLYGLCCYLLGMNGPYTYYSFKSYWASSKGFYPADFNRTFGRPLGSKVQASANVWTRDFENCHVTVDLTGQTGQIIMTTSTPGTLDFVFQAPYVPGTTVTLSLKKTG
jgi:hypothetical protein